MMSLLVGNYLYSSSTVASAFLLPTLLAHVLDSLYLHFCEEALSPLLTKVRFWSWVDLTLTMCLSQSFEISSCSALILLIWIW